MGRNLRIFTLLKIDSSPFWQRCCCLYGLQNTAFRFSAGRTGRYESSVKISMKYINSTKSLNRAKSHFFEIFDLIKVTKNNDFSLKKMISCLLGNLYKESFKFLLSNVPNR